MVCITGAASNDSVLCVGSAACLLNSGGLVTLLEPRGGASIRAEVALLTVQAPRRPLSPPCRPKSSSDEWRNTFRQRILTGIRLWKAWISSSRASPTLVATNSRSVLSWVIIWRYWRDMVKHKRFSRTRSMLQVKPSPN